MLDLITPIEMHRPPVMHFGTGMCAMLNEWVTQHGFVKPVVIADPVNAKRLDLLQLSNVHCFGDVNAEPDIEMLNRAIAAAKGADAIIGFGGGSAMDLAKLVAALVGQNMGLDDISGSGRAPMRKLGLAQIPTTAGTGSEVGTRALLTNPETRSKVATESVHLLADIVIIDPALTQSVPSMVTAATGIDAMAHCVEAFTSKRAHPIIDAYAVQGIQLVGKYLKRAVEDGDDIQARAGLALAAFYGGICLGPVNTTAGHATAYPLGTRNGLAHGLANALMFPHVLAVNNAAVKDKTQSIGSALGFETKTTHHVLDGAMNFCRELGLDMQLRSHAVPKNDLPIMAKDAHAIRRLLDWNPVDLAEHEILELYHSAW